MVSVQNKKTFKHYVQKVGMHLIAVIIASFGCCLAIKAEIGISAWDALSATLAQVLNLKIGTMSAIMNGMCVFVQICLERRRFPPMQLIQIANVAFIGWSLNIFVYTVFPEMAISSYFMRLIAVSLGYIILAFGIVMIVEVRLLRSPLEAVCQIIADNRKSEMGKIRQRADIVFVVLSFFLTVLFQCAFMVREGTLICVVILGPMLWLFRTPIQKMLKWMRVCL